jgi:DNA-binding PadR family transcriptional regulator
MSSSAPNPRSLNEWVVLTLVDESPRHGFSIAREVKQGGPIGEVWTVPRPLVYRALDHLESLQLIAPTSTELGDRGAVRTLFTTTPRGHRLVAEWLEEPIVHPRDVRTDLIVKFILLARRDRSSSGLAAAQLAQFQAAADGLEEKLTQAKGDELVVALWRAESMRAITRYLEQAAGTTGS